MNRLKLWVKMKLIKFLDLDQMAGDLLTARGDIHKLKSKSSQLNSYLNHLRDEITIANSKLKLVNAQLESTNIAVDVHNIDRDRRSKNWAVIVWNDGDRGDQVRFVDLSDRNYREMRDLAEHCKRMGIPREHLKFDAPLDFGVWMNPEIFR